jgi:hypothetical protein
MTIYGVGFPPVAGLSELVDASLNPSQHALYISVAGCTEVRSALSWARIQTTSNPDPNTWQWSYFDDIVRVCAQNGLTVLPILYHTPGWIHMDEKQPPDTTASLGDWGRFCYYVADRYGPAGTFWQANPSLLQHAITLYEIWNEPNKTDVDFHGTATQYASVYNTAFNAIHARGPGLQAMVGGLAYYPDPVAAGGYLDQLKASGIYKPDAVGYHPYGSDPSRDGSATNAHGNTIGRIKFFLSKLTDLGWGDVGADITEDGIPAIDSLYPEQWDRYNYFWDTARVIKHSYPRVRRYHAYTWYIPPPDDTTWNIANADPTIWREAVSGYARGIAE